MFLLRSFTFLLVFPVDLQVPHVTVALCIITRYTNKLHPLRSLVVECSQDQLRGQNLDSALKCHWKVTWSPERQPFAKLNFYRGLKYKQTNDNILNKTDGHRAKKTPIESIDFHWIRIIGLCNWVTHSACEWCRNIVLVAPAVQTESSDGAELVRTGS